MADTKSLQEKKTQGTSNGSLSILSSLESASFGRLTRGMNVFGSIWIVFIVLLVVGDVFGREIFNYPIPATKEMVQLSIPAIVFLQLANTLRDGRHVSSDVLMGVVQRRWPRVSVAFFGLFNLIGMAVMGMISILIAPKAWQAYDQDFEKGTQGIFTLPEWPVMAIVILGSGVMALQYMLLALRDFHAAATGRINPDQLHFSASE
jgi:TRAP-type mannitol/chloroaromatic compound transport system permease small subunit